MWIVRLRRKIGQGSILAVARIRRLSFRSLLEGTEVLGCDIGSSSIKIARLFSSKREIKILDFWVKEIPREEKGKARDEVITKTLTEFLSQIEGEKRIISSLPTSSSVIKTLFLPFKGLKRIRQVIKYEMEPYLPFPLNEAIIDFYVIDDRFPAKTYVSAYGINKRVVEEHLRLLEGAGLKPSLIGLDSIALFNSYSGGANDETVALINLGASQTIIDIVTEGRLFLTRSIRKAGDDISQSLSRGLGISFSEAERLKKEGLSGEQSKLIEPVLEEIRREIEYTFSSFLASYPDKKIKKILLTGGSSRLSQIAEYLRKDLKIEISFLSPFRLPAPPTKTFTPRRGPGLLLHKIRAFFFPGFKAITTNLDRDTLQKALPLLPQAMGMGLPGITRLRTNLNFVREEKTLLQRLEEAKSLLKPAVILLSVVLLLGLLNLYIHFHGQKRRYQKLQEEINLVLKKTFPAVTQIVDPVLQMERGLEKREEDLALSPTVFSALTVLREISSLTPEDLGIIIEELSVDWDGTRIKGSTLVPDFSLVNSFQKALQASDYFTEVELSDAHLNRPGTSVEFRMLIRYGDER
jgi:type IV pilus assembly protein PilM